MPSTDVIHPNDDHIRVNLTVGDQVVASDPRSPGGVRMSHRFESHARRAILTGRLEG